MNEPWFDPNHYAWIPGTVLGTLSGLMGGVAGNLAPRGKAMSLVLGGLGLLLEAGVVCLIFGILALFYHQPYGETQERVQENRRRAASAAARVAASSLWLKARSDSSQRRKAMRR